MIVNFYLVSGSKKEYENAVKLIDASASSELQTLLEQEKAQDDEQVMSLYQETKNVIDVCF